MSKRCQVVVGRLVSHPCAQRSFLECDGCRRPMCERHTSKTTPGTCVTCSREHVPPQAPIAVGIHELYGFSEDDAEAFEAGQPPSLHDFDS